MNDEHDFYGKDGIINNPSNHKKVIDVKDREDINVSSNTWDKKGEEDIETTIHHHRMARDGRRLPVEDFTAESWTGESIPSDKAAPCLNPFDLHEYRLVYLEIDGRTTELGNTLCTECLAYNKAQIDFADSFKCLWGLLYKPEIY